MLVATVNKTGEGPMATNSSESASSQKIAVQCSCGKKLATAPQHVGKRLKCPSCGDAIVVPAMSSAQPRPTALNVEDKPEGLSKTTLITMCSVVGGLALGCALFLVWHSNSAHQKKISDANVALSNAVSEAQEWLSNGDGEADAIENALSDSLQNQLVTEKSKGEAVLADVQKRRAEIVADATFDSAKEKLGQKEITDAVSLLEKYVADPNATEKSEAQSLLSQAEVAMSDKLALDTLNSMSDEEFDRVKASGIIGDGKVTHPILLAVRKDTVQRQLESVGKQREEIRIADEKRRETERLAVLDRRRQEEQRRKQEAARLAERERLRDGTDLFKQITTFSERYMGMNFYIRGLLFPSDTSRNKDFKCFSIKFAYKSAVVGGPFRDRISFITTEEMGAKLIEMGSGSFNATVYVKLRHLDPDKKEYPVGHVTKIEFSQLDVKVVKEYKAATLYDTGKIERHPNPFKR